MKLFRSSAQRTGLDIIAEKIKTTTDTNLYSTLFIELIAALRPQSGAEEAVGLMSALLQRLEQDKALASGLRQMFVYLLNTRDSQSIFTNVGILGSGTFFSEMLAQIRHRILPPLPEKRSLNYLLQKAFHKPDDYRWVRAIPDELWLRFFQIVSGALQQKDSPLLRNLTGTLTILSYRVSYLGLEDELNSQIRSDTRLISPFLEQNRKIQSFVHLINKGNSAEAYLLSSAQDVLSQVQECEHILDDIRESTVQYGTSLGQSYLLSRTAQQLKRILIIVQFLAPGSQPQEQLSNAVRFFKDVVESVNKRYSISDLYRKNSGMLAYQIAEHKSASGEHYITTTRPEYTAFFYAAVAGGVIIAFAALVKALLHKVHMPLFWQYFCYGLNYAIAFVALFITGASLATKQPTMTASALAGSMDSRKGEQSFEGLAITFGKIWRSQFASFAGNLIVVFPLSYLLSVAWQYLTGDALLHDQREALQSLRDQNPTTSLAWLYACVTGVCLFISGIITGYVDNKVIYGHFGARLREHKGLRKIYSGARLQRVSDAIVRNLGGIAGNVSLGFMLGYAKFIGDFFGIPFDIRHITISTAYFAFGVDGMGNHVGAWDWIWTTIGVIGIGFFNFLVSFSLAFYVAIRSRNVPVSKLPNVGRVIWKYLVRHPLDFIYPPGKERKEADVFRPGRG